MNASWAIVITRSDEGSEIALRRSGYRSWLPRYRRCLGARSGMTMRPVFGGMVFVQDWHGWPQHSVTGALGLMRCGQRLVALSDDDIALLQARERAGEFDDPRHGERRTDLDRGQAVEFDLVERRVRAVVEQLSDSGKAIVSAMLGDRATRLTIDQAELRVSA